MKVLVIAHAYPPAPASGAQRAGNVVRALQAAGADVRVITHGARGERATTRDTHVVDIGMWPSGIDVLVALARLGARARSLGRASVGGRAGSRPDSGFGPAASSGVGAVPAGIDPMDPGPRFRRWVTAAMRFPDGHLGFLAPAIRAAIGAGGADVVYTTGPPVTAHLTGLCIHALSGTPWVAEYRDPWIVDGGPYKEPALRTGPTDVIERGLAGLCHAAAAEVVAVSEGIAGVIDPWRATAGRPPAHVVLNGIPELSPARRTAGRSGPVRILHLGNLYAFRDPGPFFETLAALREDRAMGPEAILVDFVGDEVPSYVRGHVEARGLGDIVRFVDWVPHETGQALIRDADILLLLAQRQPLQVPNKLYEYLGSRNPILAFADRGGESARMLGRVGRHRLVTETDGLAQSCLALEQLLAEARIERPPSEDRGEEAVLNAWTTTRQLRALHEILGRARGRHAPA